MTDNPITRLALFLVVLDLGLELAYELIRQIAPYLLIGLLTVLVWRLVRWHRERW